MAKRAIFLLIVGACAAALASPTFASTRSLRHLTGEEWTALQESEQRLAIFDRQYELLDARRAARKISFQEYGFEQHDLNALIAGEAKIQNGLLKKRRWELPEDEREVLLNIAKDAVLIPTYAVLIILRCLPSDGSFPR